MKNIFGVLLFAVFAVLILVAFLLEKSGAFKAETVNMKK
jgi:hypothetical protein